MKPTLNLIAVFALAIMALILSGCGGSGSGTTGGGSGGGTGTLAVHLVDAPLQGVTAVDANITTVDAHVNGQWVKIGNFNQTVNLLDLRTHDALLASGPLPAGSYTQVRFLVTSATVTDATGTHPVTIPSGSQTGIKVNVNFTIQANTITDILLDFNLDKSLHVLGNGSYMLQPVVPATVITLSGTISGTVMDNGAAAPGAQVTAIYRAGSNYPLGTQVNTATTLADGTFKVWTLLQGTYDLSVSFTESGSGIVKSATVFGLVVTAGQDTPAGVISVVQPGSISGVVSNGAVVSGATVTATYSAGGNLPAGTVAGSTTTAADGSFSITNLPPGTYTINVSSGAQVGVFANVVVAAGADTALGTITIA